MKSYKNKYLKYKLKYLKLKNKQRYGIVDYKKKIGGFNFKDMWNSMIQPKHNKDMPMLENPNSIKVSQVYNKVMELKKLRKIF